MESVQNYAWFPPRGPVLPAEQLSKILDDLRASSLAVVQLSPEQATVLSSGFADAGRLVKTSLPVHSSLSPTLACHWKEIETKGRLQVNWAAKPSAVVQEAAALVKTMELMEQVALSVLRNIFEEIGPADVMQVVCQKHLVQPKCKSVFNAYLYKSYEQVGQYLTLSEPRTASKLSLVACTVTPASCQSLAEVRPVRLCASFGLPLIGSRASSSRWGRTTSC
jgi:hypothetical protein